MGLAREMQLQAEVRRLERALENQLAEERDIALTWSAKWVEEHNLYVTQGETLRRVYQEVERSRREIQALRSDNETYRGWMTDVRGVLDPPGTLPNSVLFKIVCEILDHPKVKERAKVLMDRYFEQDDEDWDWGN